MGKPIRNYSLGAIMFSKQEHLSSDRARIQLFLKSKAELINNIAVEMNSIMANICAKMAQIQIYSKDDIEENEKVYNPLIIKIQTFFNYIQNLNLAQYPDINDPFLIKALKKQIFLTFLSNYKEKTLELLFCAQTLDSDLLLACARRANQCIKKDRHFILCDIEMCRELTDLEVPIENVVNLGILHHYLPIDLSAALNASSTIKVSCDPHIKKAVLDVIHHIPGFINKCLTQIKPVKVVLRSCYGVELNGGDNIIELKETKTYPIKIRLLDKHAQLVPELKQTIIIQQTVIDGRCETQLELPIEGALPIRLQEGLFPELSDPDSFTQFAQELLKKWTELHVDIPHINPFSIQLDASLLELKGGRGALLRNGLLNFKKVFIDALEDWEGEKKNLKSPKALYKGVFTTTSTLKNVTVMPRGSYAHLLLESIIKNPCIGIFKAYYADYRAGPDRTILAMDRKGINSSSPKALEVSREMMMGCRKA